MLYIQYYNVPNRRIEEMPRKGYRSLTVKEKVFERLQKIAEETHRTIPEMIEHLTENQQTNGQALGKLANIEQEA